MTYEECMNLIEAFQGSVELVNEMDRSMERSDMKTKAEHVRDYLGEFIGSLLNESPIGDRRRKDDDD